MRLFHLRYESEHVGCSVMSDSLRPHGLLPTGSSIHRFSPGKNTGVAFPSPGDLPHPGIEPKSPALQAGSLPSEPPGKPLKSLPESLELSILD